MCHPTPNTGNGIQETDMVYKYNVNEINLII